MPVNPTITTPIFNAILLAHGDLGPSRSQLASGLALGLYQYMQTAVTATSIDVGSLGVGVGSGVGITLAVPALVTAMVASFNGNGIVGPMSAPNAAAVANATSMALAAAVLVGFHPGVGAGAGKLQLLPKGTGGPIFIAAFKAAGMEGPSSEKLAMAVSLGLDATIALATGVIAIAGPPSPSPGGGAGLVSIQ